MLILQTAMIRVQASAWCVVSVLWRTDVTCNDAQPQPIEMRKRTEAHESGYLILSADLYRGGIRRRLPRDSVFLFAFLVTVAMLAEAGQA
jgi:hypothetical protein